MAHQIILNKSATNSKSSLHLHNLLTFSNPISQYKSFSSFANVVFCLYQVSNSFSQNAHFFFTDTSGIFFLFSLCWACLKLIQRSDPQHFASIIYRQERSNNSLSLDSIACTKQRRFAFAPKMKRNESIFGQSDQCLISP